MPNLFGTTYTREQIDARTGRFGAVAGIVPVDLRDGRARGVRALEVATGSGLSFAAIADRGLDVARAHFAGIPLCWESCNEIASPAYYEPEGDGFLRTFMGGLFTTCGLTNFGPAGSDAWGTFGLHGRIDATPAGDVAHETRWLDAERCVLEIRGTMRETRVFGENMRLERRIRAPLGEKRIAVHDEVTNDGGSRSPHMILYHCNGGFPILDDESRLHVSHASVRPRDARAEEGLVVWDRGGAPERGFKEQVFIHEPVACADGRAAAVLVNPAIREGAGLALAVRFDPAQLPALFTWRMLGYGTYVMGIEPANCVTIEGRVEAGKRGTLPFLEPGESRSYDLEFEVYDRADELDAVLRAMPGSIRDAR